MTRHLHRADLEGLAASTPGIDEQVRQLIDTADQNVTAVVDAHRNHLEALAQALLRDETLDESTPAPRPGSSTGPQTHGR